MWSIVALETIASQRAKSSDGFGFGFGFGCVVGGWVDIGIEEEEDAGEGDIDCRIEAEAETEVESPMVEGQLCEQSVQPQGQPPPAESGEPLSWTSTGMALGDGACAEMGLCGSGWCVVV